MADEEKQVDQQPAVDEIDLEDLDDSDPLADMPEDDDEEGSYSAVAEDDEEEESTETPPDAEDEPASDDKPVWDKERQKKDQELATLRKKVAELEGKTETAETLDDLLEPLAEASGTLPQLPPVPKAPKPLDPYATDEEREQYWQEVADFNAATERFNQAVFERDTQIAAKAESLANQKKAMELLDNGVKLVGEEQRNALIARVKEVFAARGYTKDKPPTPEQAEDIVQAQAYRLMVEKGPATPGKTRPKTQDRPAPGRQATATKTYTGAESLRDVVQDMKLRSRKARLRT